MPPQGEHLCREAARPIESLAGVCRSLLPGVAPHRIDIVTEIDGVSFTDAYPNRFTVDIDNLSVPVIGRSDLIRNKKTTGRQQDLADLESLGS